MIVKREPRLIVRQYQQRFKLYVTVLEIQKKKEVNEEKASENILIMKRVLFT